VTENVPDNPPDNATDPGDASDGPSIRLDQFLKWMGAVGTGGEAKFRIQGGEVAVNGEVESRRRRKLRPGDRVRVGDDDEIVVPELGRDGDLGDAP